MQADPTMQEAPRLRELIGLLDWPWKLALGLLLLAPLPLLLEHSGWPPLPGAAGGIWATLALAGGGALLALLSGVRALRGLLAGDEPPAAPQDMARSEADQVIGGLRGLLQEQRMQTQEATLALSRSVTSGAQLAGIARALDTQCKATLAVAQAGLPAEAAQPVLAALRQTVSRVEAELDSATARLAAMAERVGPPARLEAVPDRPEAAVAESGRPPPPEQDQAAGMAQRIAELEASWQALPAVALRIEAAAARSQEALAEAAEHAALREAADTRRLAVHQQVVERNEATLGDAARFLAETTDRFREGVTELGTQAVRLQAMGFAGQGRSDGASQEMLAALAEQIAAATRLGASLRITQASLAAAPPAGGTVTRLLAELEPAGLPPAIRTTLRSLGHVEEHTTRLLADIEGLARGGMALPTAVNGRAPELLRAMQDSIHRLNTAATALALASDGAACETA